MTPTADIEFHHIGIACRDLDIETRPYLPLGYSPVGPDFVDPLQGITGRFLEGPGPRLELVRPTDDGDTVLTGMLQRGVKMYHLAFMAEQFDAAVQDAISRRGKMVVAPVPAVAFGGRRICFIFLANLMLLELVER